MSAPSWLLDGPQTASDEPAQPWVATTLGAPHLCPPGAQHDTLIRLCWWAAGHLEYDIAFGMLTSWARQLPLADRPWTQEDVRTRLESAYAKRVPDAGRAGPLVDGSTGTGASPSRIDDLFITADLFAAEQPPEIDWIVPDFISSGEWTEVIGLMKSGKSTLVYWMIHAILHGHDFLGRTVKQGPVILYTEQDRNSLRATLERAGLLDAGNLHVLRASKTRGKAWAEVIPAVIDYASRIGVDVVVVDTLNSLAGVVDTNEDSEAQRVMGACQSAKEKGVSLVFLRHSNKKSDNLASLGLAGRGSGQFTGAMDTVAVLSTPEGEDSRYRLLIVGGRLIDHQKMHLTYKNGHHEVDPEGAPLTHDQQSKVQQAADAKAVRAILERGSASAVDMSSATGRSESTILRRLKEIGRAHV